MPLAVALALATISALPAAGQLWSHYENSRFGYALDIPPGYQPQGESDNGDGQVFIDTATTQALSVWGGFMLEDFEAEVRSAMEAAEGDAWNITGETSTPDWAEFTAIQGARVFRQRMIAGCDGAAYAAFRLEYLVTDTPVIGEVVDGLAPTFLPPTAC